MPAKSSTVMMQADMIHDIPTKDLEYGGDKPAQAQEEYTRAKGALSQGEIISSQ